MSDPSPVKKPFYLSASRIDTFLDCSYLYYCKYILKLPDSGNDGSRRGSTVHDTLELLLKPRHHKIYVEAVHRQTCKEVPALWRLVQKFARKYGVGDDENLDMIDGFIVVALNNEFKGPKGTVAMEAEKDFDIQVSRGDIKYNVRGFLDQVFHVENQFGKSLSVRDFKSSKQKYSGEKVDWNLQSLIYQLALRHLYPDIPKRDFHFLFLNFPRKPRQDQPSFNDDVLNGLESILTSYQLSMESFTHRNAQDNLAAFNPEKKWKCGKEGLNKEGKVAWMCPARDPFDYWVVLDESSAIVASAFKESDLKVEAGQKIEKRRHKGCVAFWNPATGKKRRIS